MKNRFQRKSSVSLVAALSALLGAARFAAADEVAAPAEITVVTFNILVDLFPSPGFPGWSQRKAHCAKVLHDSAADLIGLQEPSPKQAAFFIKELPEYDSIFHKGYHDAMLFYKKAVFEELERGEWWLSPTPARRASVGFGNVMPRLVVWAKLRHRPTSKVLFVFNTHFDNTRPSQQKMAELCEKQMQPFAAQGVPMIFMGDFNTDQGKGDYPRLTSNGWQDAYKVSPAASADGRDSNVPTTHDGARIDHIFYFGKDLVAKSWQRIESPDPAIALSDHFPVQARFELR